MSGVRHPQRASGRRTHRPRPPSRAGGGDPHRDGPRGRRGVPVGPACAAGSGALRLGDDPDRMRQQLHVLHRARSARPRDQPPLRRTGRRGAGTAAGGVSEVTLLGQNVKSELALGVGRDRRWTRCRSRGSASAMAGGTHRGGARRGGARGGRTCGPGLSPTCSVKWGRSTASAVCASPARIPRICGLRPSRPWPRFRPCASTCTCRCSPAATPCFGPCGRGYTAERYLERLRAARAAVDDLAVIHRHHRRVPRRDRQGLRADPGGGGRGPLRQRLHVHLLVPARHRGRRDGRPVRGPPRVRGPLRAAAAGDRALQPPRQRGPHRQSRGGRSRKKDPSVPPGAPGATRVHFPRHPADPRNPAPTPGSRSLGRGELPAGPP